MNAFKSKPSAKYVADADLDKEIAKRFKDLSQENQEKVMWFIDAMEESADPLASLPVAPEFVSVLQETIFETMQGCLKKLNAPEELHLLNADMMNLAYYMETCYTRPKTLTGDDPTFDGMNTTIQAINHIAALGGSFTSGISQSVARKGSFLDKKE